MGIVFPLFIILNQEISIIDIAWLSVNALYFRPLEMTLLCPEGWSKPLSFGSAFKQNIVSYCK